MSFEIRYHPDVKNIDIPLIDLRTEKRIKKAIETRLITAPHQYGEPLRKTLKGYWKLRVGDYRVIMSINTKERKIFIEKIGHRKEIYKK